MNQKPVVRVALGAEVNHLFEESNALFESSYPDESNHLVDADTFTQPGNLLLAAFIEDVAIGCVGLIAAGDWAEIKRLIVLPRYRRQGVGRALMEELEHRARLAGFLMLRLETGILQTESLELYENLGYRRVEPFGDYRPDPLSVFFEKTLTA